MQKTGGKVRCLVGTIEFEYFQTSSNICCKHQILKLFFIGHLWIPEFRTVSKYTNFGNIRPIWERIFPIEFEYFFEKFLSISFRIRIVSNRTISISVEVYEYCRYLGLSGIDDFRTCWYWIKGIGVAQSYNN